MRHFKDNYWLYPVNLLLTLGLAGLNYSRGSMGIGHIWSAMTVFWVIRILMLWLEKKKDKKD